ncbi:MAG: hypothetical protein U0521_20090 [Anaerolineae bacterium]
MALRSAVNHYFSGNEGARPSRQWTRHSGALGVQRIAAFYTLMRWAAESTEQVLADAEC